MVAISSETLSATRVQIATRSASILVPLFDPPYSVINNAAVTFSYSSPWPHFMPDFRRQANGQISYEKTQVLAPFSVSTLTWGNTAIGTHSGNAKASFYADKDVVLSPGSGGFFNNRVFHPNNVLAVAGGPINLGSPGSSYPTGEYGTGPSYRDFDPYFMWQRLSAISNDWNYASLNLVLDVLTFDNLFNECDVCIPMPLVSGADFLPSFSLLQNFKAWNAPNFNSKILRIINGFSNSIGKNIYALNLDANVLGTSLWLLGLNTGTISSNLLGITFDDPNITTLVNAENCEVQGTNFGWLITWGKAVYELIPGQGVQSILLSCAIDPIKNNLTNPFYAPIIFSPKTTKSNTAVSISDEASVKIDPSGTFYLRNTGAGSDPTYVANSFGLDISIPGVTINPTNNGSIGLPSFCPCSPVAIPVPG